MNESTIKAEAPIVTFINVFTVAPDRQRELIDVLISASDHVMRHLPGFISGNFHASTDGTTIVNYVQWDSLESLEEAQSDPAARGHMETAVGIADKIEPHVHRVVAVHHR